MLVARYRHRLPADYAMDRVRARVAERAAAWDKAPGLAFKAFAIEDRARGAAANAYSSLYLWRDAGAAADFLAGPGFRSVIESFGRPRIETWLAFGLSRGRAAAARTLTEEQRLVGPEDDIGALRVSERARGRDLAGRDGVLASLVGLDPTGWRLTRFTLWAAAPTGGAGAEVAGAEVAHLAAPGLDAAHDL